MPAKPHLVATPIVDRTGKATTVYRRPGQPGAMGRGALAAAAPTLAPQSQLRSGPADDTEITVSVPHDPRSRMILHEHGIAAGISLDDLPAEVTMTYRDAYTYLALGLETADAALLHAIDPDPEQWSADPGAAAFGKRRLDLAQAGGANGESVGEAVEFLRQGGIPPHDIDKMTANGLSDSHVRGVLDPDQLRTVFKRMRYERSTVAGKQAKAAHMMDLLIDGRLPYELAERGYRKYTLVDIAHVIFPAKQKRKPTSGRSFLTISEEDARQIREDPSKVEMIAEVMDHHFAENHAIGPAMAWHAIRAFGREEALAASPSATLQTTSDGRHVGPDGVRRVRGFAAEHLGLGKDWRSAEGVCSSYTGGPTLWVARTGEQGGDSGTYKVAEIFEALSSGRTEDEVAALVRSGLNGRQLVAVATGESIAPIADGFL